MATVCSTGAGSVHCAQEARAPSAIAQGMGLAAMPLSALRSATPAPPGWPSRDSAMHREVVTSMSTAMLTITGPAL
ncbi:hypothetical protein D3C73_1413340 [compost metagenome]